MRNKAYFLGTLLILAVLLSGCAITAPSDITAVCANWGTNCQWHPINTDYAYPTVVENGSVNSPKNNIVYTPKNTTNNRASSNDDGHDDHFEW